MKLLHGGWPGFDRMAMEMVDTLCPHAMEPGETADERRARLVQLPKITELPTFADLGQLELSFHAPALPPSEDQREKARAAVCEHLKVWTASKAGMTLDPSIEVEFVSNNFFDLFKDYVAGASTALNPFPMDRDADAYIHISALDALGSDWAKIGSDFRGVYESMNLVAALMEGDEANGSGRDDGHDGA